MVDLEKLIHQAWEVRTSLSPQDKEVRQAVDEIYTLLDQGKIRVAEKIKGQWITHEWIKKAILLSFRVYQNTLIPSERPTPQGIGPWYDKIPLKCTGWQEDDFQKAGFRMVPGALIRHSAFIGRDAILMPSYVNVGAYVGEGTLVDTWSTIGSCAQIGANCHISGGVGIGGVLEPVQANPVIIEDNCFIGARSEIAEGIIVEEGAVISMGVFLSASTKIIHRETGKVSYGRIPAYSVVVPGTLPSKDLTNPSLACAIIVKQVDEKTRSKTSINDLLRTVANETERTSLP